MNVFHWLLILLFLFPLRFDLYAKYKSRWKKYFSDPMLYTLVILIVLVVLSALF